MIDNQYILTDSYTMDINIPEFKLEEIESIGRSRVYDRAKFTNSRLWKNNETRRKVGG